MAYCMGSQNCRLKELLQEEESRMLLEKYRMNEEAICDRVVLEREGERFVKVRVRGEVGELELNTKEQPPTQAQQNRSKWKAQKDFLQRNFYQFQKEHE